MSLHLRRLSLPLAAVDKTKLQIGISETIISTAFCGITFALFSCQPLIIVGTTGPVLLFDEALFQVS